MTKKEYLWENSYPKEIPLTLNYPDVSLGVFLKETAERYPDKIAIRFLGKSLTYKELVEQTHQMAHFLSSLGIKKGDRVSIALPNCPQYVISYYATLFLGGIVVQTNPLYTETELTHQFNDADVKFVIGIDLIYPKISNILSNTNVQHVITTSIKDYLPFPKNILYPLTQKLPKILESETTHHWNAIFNHLTESVIKDVDSLNDVAVLQYTGGTTGSPKGVMLTHRNLISNITQTKAWLYKSNKSDEKILAAVPFFHVYGMTTAMNLSISIGGTLILLPKFDALDVLKTISKEKPTLFPGAPTMYISLINHPDISKYDLSSINACISGSSALPLEVQNTFESLTKGKLVEGYGLSEASPVTHCNPIWEKRINGSIGLPWSDTEMKIIDLVTGEELPTGEKGELLIKGPQVMKGYWKNEEETTKALQNGWLHTGDIGYIDNDGYTYIVDRKKEMIIAGGFNIYPREVEEILYQHPHIQEAAVIGVPDPYRGETVKAFVVFKQGVSSTDDELDQYCRKHLAAYKVPKLYEFKEELPKTMVGKILKRQLKQ